MMIRTFDIRDRIGTGWHWEWFGNELGWSHRMLFDYIFRSAGFRHMRCSGMWPASPNVTVAGKEVRLESHWVIESPMFVHDWLEHLASHGVKFDFLLGKPYPLAQGYHRWFGHERDVVKVIAERYADVTVAIEAPNEYDLGPPINADQMQPWEQHLRAFVKSVAGYWQADGRVNHLPYLGPSLVYAPSAAKLGDVSAWTDAKNSHAYSGNRVQTQAGIAAESAKHELVNPGQDLWVTEYGARPGTPPGGWAIINERQQAVVLVKQYLTHLRAGVKRSYIYLLFDQQEELGLLRSDMTPRPALLAFQRLLALCDESGQAGTPTPLTWTLEGAPADLKWIHARDRDGSALAILWRECPLGTPAKKVKLSFPGKTSKVSYDIIGGAAPCPASFSDGAKFDVTVGDDPIVIKV